MTTHDALETLAQELLSEIKEADARQYAGVKDGIAADDFRGHAYNQGVLAGLRVAYDLVISAKETAMS